MKLRQTLRHTSLLALILPLGPVAHHLSASPLVSIGDSADIFFNGSSSLLWSSNVYRDETNEIDDFWWTLTPGFELNIGRGVTNADLTIVTRYEIRRYADLDDLDTELFSIQANGSYRSSRLDLSSSAYFREEKSSTGDANLLNDLVESDNYGNSLDAEYRISPKFSAGAGFRYSETEYKSPYDAFFADRQRFEVPIDVFYELTPKVDLSVGYAYSETDVDGTPLPPLGTGVLPYTTEDHYFNVGARGNLLPKLTGFFKVGYRTRDDDVAGSSSESTLGINSDLTWAATPKLTHQLNLSRDFGVSGEGFSSENTSVGVTSNYSINSYYAATVFADYTLRDFAGQNTEDNQYRLGARLTYTPNQNWRIGGGYTYSENDSDRVNYSYTDHTLDFTVTLRY